MRSRRRSRSRSRDRTGGDRNRSDRQKDFDNKRGQPQRTGGGARDKVFVGGLDYHLSEEDFSAFFSYTMISFGEQKRMVGAYVFTALTSLIL